MGVMSTRVLPICGNLCCFCPSLRSRSRHPVKRYKKLLADAMLKTQGGDPNYRMISKLCEYAAKNPMRIPKITASLEQNYYKELRSGHLSQVEVVPCIYSKMLASCKDQMPLFALSLLSIVRTLLEQTRQDEMRILGCHMLVDFLNCQVNGTYIFNLEGLIPKICQVAREVGSDDIGLRLRSSALQALAFLVKFMGDFSHISADLDEIVSVALNNYEVQKIYTQNELRNMALNNHETSGSSKNPSYWSMICLQNMAKISKEATTMRRVLEPLFYSFDCENYWSPNKGVALSVLSEMQILMESSGQNSHLLLSSIIKHLDHKNVAKRPDMQCNILDVATNLAKHAKTEASVAIINAISNLIWHLRKCMQQAIESSNLENESSNWISLLHSAIEVCLAQLTKRVGDCGPILDMLAVTLENIPIPAITARTTISSVYRTAQISALLPNISYHKKSFPEALFHQLLLAMTHPDHETRIGAHRVLSVILAPPITFPWWDPSTESLKGSDAPRRTLLITLSGFSSSATLEKLAERNSPSSAQDLSYESILDTKLIGMGEDKLDMESKSLRLSSYQVGLLLSSIWSQATSKDNTPSNYEALACSYDLALSFSRAKASNHAALIRCFRLAFSLWSISCDPGNPLQLSRRRSLLTLASAMIASSAWAADLPHLNSSVQDIIRSDPHFHLEEGVLRAVHVELSYGSEEDNFAAAKFLATVEADNGELKHAIITQLMRKYAYLQEEERSAIESELSEAFSPYMGSTWHVETPFSTSPIAVREPLEFNESIVSSLEDEDVLPEASGSLSNSKISETLSGFDVLSVNMLMDSVMETTREVSRSPTSNPISYDQMRTQCETLLLGKQHKMSALLRSFREQPEPLPPPEKKCGLEEPQRREANVDPLLPPLMLPPASPYDKFLEASGCRRD